MDQPLVLGTIPRSTHGSTRKRGRNRTKKQSSQPLADRPARHGGLSVMVARTVRQGTADCPPPCRGLSSLSRGPSVKANRTSRTDPRKTNRPRRPSGPSATKARTVRKPAATKTKSKTGSNRNEERTRRTPRGTGTVRTVLLVQTEQKTHDLESQLPQIIIGFPKRLKL
jgi:hypothetical protein